jgi:hypothetical protein
MLKILLSCFMILAALMLGSAVATAQTWHTANQVTLAWDPVPPPNDQAGNPLPGDITYQCYIKFQLAGSDPVPIGEPTADTQKVIAFPSEGRYFLCAQTLRLPPDAEEPLTSAIVCSDDPAVTADNQAFGVVYYIGPASPVSFRLN